MKSSKNSQRSFCDAWKSYKPVDKAAWIVAAILKTIIAMAVMLSPWIMECIVWLIKR